jgi:hypothetical protein
VEAKKGEMLSLGVIELKPVIRTASLVIEGATREAEVLIDGNARGVIGVDGSFRLDDLSPDAHTVTLRRPDFEDKVLSKTFTVGQAVRVSGPDGQLTPFGALDFRVTPPGASITYKRAEEAQARAADNGKTVHLKAGRYVVTATGNGNPPRQEAVTVEAGKSLPIDWTLSRPPAPESKKGLPPLPLPPASDFADPTAWARDGVWRIHKGADMGWMHRNQGVFLIEFQRQKTGIMKRTRRVEWVIDQRDLPNRIEYSFDFTNLERRVTVNGKAEAKKVKLPAAAASGESYAIQIEIGLERIVIRDASGNALDQYSRPNRTEPLGRFGFKGDVALAVKKAD